MRETVQSIGPPLYPKQTNSHMRIHSTSLLHKIGYAKLRVLINSDYGEIWKKLVG